MTLSGKEVSLDNFSFTFSPWGAHSEWMLLQEDPNPMVTSIVAGRHVISDSFLDSLLLPCCPSAREVRANDFSFFLVVFMLSPFCESLLLALRTS